MPIELNGHVDSVHFAVKNEDGTYSEPRELKGILMLTFTIPNDIQPIDIQPICYWGQDGLFYIVGYDWE